LAALQAAKRAKEAAASAGAEGGLSSTSGNRVSNAEKVSGRSAESGLGIRSKLGKQATGTAKDVARRIKMAENKEETSDAMEDPNGDDDLLSAEKAGAPYSPQF
jgi:hypothetical protein